VDDRSSNKLAPTWFCCGPSGNSEPLRIVITAVKKSRKTLKTLKTLKVYGAALSENLNFLFPSVLTGKTGSNVPFSSLFEFFLPFFESFLAIL